MTWQIRQGDALERLREMPDESVQCCITSPPYWGLRDYGVEGQLGLEATPEEYVEKLVAIFEEVRRVLRDDGTLWLNLGDSYWSAKGTPGGEQAWRNGKNADEKQPARRFGKRPQDGPPPSGIKAKDLVGIPWLTAFALRTDGWWLRSEIIWHKPNGIPGGGVRTTKPDRFHEHLFLLSKSSQYFYDAGAISEPITPEQLAHNKRYEKHYETHSQRSVVNGQPGNVNNEGIHSRRGGDRRTKRSVWKIATVPFSEAHFATFPPKLVEPCILAGAPGGATVLDPFAGAATTGLVATQHGRDFIGIELNPEYVQLGEDRIRRWEANPAGHLKGDAPPIDGQRSIEEVIEEGQAAA